VPTFDWSAQGGNAPAQYEEFLVPAMFTPFAETLMVQAGVEEGSDVLDVACGTGAASRAAARRAGPGGSVTGLDLGEPTLAIARATPPEEGAAPITFKQSDAAALDVEDDTFDVAICQQGLQFFPDRPAALAEMRRALKPGGRLAVATWTEMEGNPFGAVVVALEHNMSSDAASMLASPFALTAEELGRVIADAGFSDVQVLQEEQLCTFDARPEEFGPRAIACGPLAATFAGAPEEAQRAVAEEAGERLSQHVDGDGRVRMPMVSNVALARA
jgi:ubiquinone/menaquinone biosynthesis C-methylase UbiE